MTEIRVRAVGSAALWLSLLVFVIYFLNVLVGGPLGKKPWMSDLWEMLTLLLAIILFVSGTLVREFESKQKKSEKKVDSDD